MDTDWDQLGRIGAFTQKIMLSNGIFIRVHLCPSVVCLPSTAGFMMIEPPFTPRNMLKPYQRRWADDTSRWKFGLMARQTGKDFCSAEEGVRDCFMHEKNGGKTTWLIAAPSERQSIESLAKWKEWTEAYKLAEADILEEREGGSEALLKSVTIIFPRGSRVIAVPGRPDTVRGYSANVLLTEFAFFENPEQTWRAIVPAVTNPLRGGVKKVRLLTTPNGIGNKARFSNVQSVAVGGGGNIYVLDGDLIRKITPAGVVTTMFHFSLQPSAFSISLHPTSIAVDSTGNLFLIEGMNNVVWEVTPPKG